MIDDKMLEFRERGCLEKAELMRAQWRAGPVEEYTLEAEIIRNARRYLELKKQFAPFSMDIDGNHSWCWRGNPSRMKGPTLDAAADRLLEGGE